MDVITLLGPGVGSDGQALRVATGGPLELLDHLDHSARVVPAGFAEAGLTLLLMTPAAASARRDDEAGEREQRLADAVAKTGVASLRELSVTDLLRVRDELDGPSYRLVRHVVTENQRVRDTLRMLRDEGPAGIGDLLFESHRSLRDDVGISRPELDLAVEISQNYGALGARMSNEGDAVALVPLHYVSQVQVAVDGAFSEHGWAQPEMQSIAPEERVE